MLGERGRNNCNTQDKVKGRSVQWGERARDERENGLGDLKHLASRGILAQRYRTSFPFRRPGFKCQLGRREDNLILYQIKNGCVKLPSALQRSWKEEKEEEERRRKGIWGSTVGGQQKREERRRKGIIGGCRRRKRKRSREGKKRNKRELQEKKGKEKGAERGRKEIIDVAEEKRERKEKKRNKGKYSERKR